MYRYKRSIPCSYERQGYIYFVSKLYRELSERDQMKIRKLCEQCGREHKKALFDFVTTDATATEICMKNYLSRSTLERIVRKYYRAFPKKL